MIRVFIVDDHALIRKGIRQILEEQPDISLVGEASNGPEVLSRLPSLKADIILLDISLPGMNGLELLDLLRKESPNICVLILSMHPEEQMILN